MEYTWIPFLLVLVVMGVHPGIVNTFDTINASNPKNAKKWACTIINHHVVHLPTSVSRIPTISYLQYNHALVPSPSFHLVFPW